jgi:hypothetical protein
MTTRDIQPSTPLGVLTWRSPRVPGDLHFVAAVEASDLIGPEVVRFVGDPNEPLGDRSALHTGRPL